MSEQTNCENNHEGNSKEIILVWEGPSETEITEEEVSQFCYELFSDKEYFVLSDFWVVNFLKELNGDG